MLFAKAYFIAYGSERVKVKDFRSFYDTPLNGQMELLKFYGKRFGSYM